MSGASSRRIRSLLACQVLANGAKHLVIDFSRQQYKDQKNRASDATMSVSSVHVMDSPVGDKRFRVKAVFEDGDRIRATEVVDDALSAWGAFLGSNKLLD
jgi:hypothetical protein